MTICNSEDTIAIENALMTEQKNLDSTKRKKRKRVNDDHNILAEDEIALDAYSMNFQQI